MFHAPAKSVLVSVHRLPSEASTNGHSGNSICNTVSQHEGRSGKSLQVELLLQTEVQTKLFQPSKVMTEFQNLYEYFCVSYQSFNNKCCVKSSNQQGLLWQSTVIQLIRSVSVLMKPTRYLLHSQTPQSNHILSQFNPILTYTFQFFKKHFNIILSVSLIPVARTSTAAAAHP
jgi:hypothetical protein